MTFGFFLLTMGFLLLESGWRGSTPVDVLRGLSQPGAGGPLAAVGSGALEGVAGPLGTPGAAPAGVGGAIKPGQKGKEASLKQAHPELKPGIRTVTAVVMSQFPGLTITATTNGTHVSGSYHYKGRAVDLAGPAAEMNQAAQWISKYLTHTLTEGIHNPGLSVKNKRAVSSSIWGAEIWAGHANHIHLAV